MKTSYDCADCCDTGKIGGDPCDVCAGGGRDHYETPVEAIIRICEASEYNEAWMAREALKEIHEIAKRIRGDL